MSGPPQGIPLRVEIERDAGAGEQRAGGISDDLKGGPENLKLLP